MKVRLTPAAFFSELTKNSERYLHDGTSAKLQVKGEHRVKLWLRNEKQPPFSSQLLLQVSGEVTEITTALVGDRYRLESEQNGDRIYVVLDACSSARIFIDTALEAVAILDKIVMIKRMAIALDSNDHGADDGVEAGSNN